METIISLKPNMTEGDAVAQFEGRGVAAWARALRQGPLRSIALVHIPFRLFVVEISNYGRHQRRWLAQDAVTGKFDPYLFQGELPAEDLLCVPTRNRAPAALSWDESQQLLTDKVRRSVFGSGFFRVRDLEIHAKATLPEFHVPYWVGFSGLRDTPHVAVIDAVRRNFEGSRVCGFVCDWLRNQPRTENRKARHIALQ